MAGKHKRLRLTPSHLPLIRDGLVKLQKRNLQRQLAEMPQYRRTITELWNDADQLSTAQLWWVSRDMTKLAEDTAQAGNFPTAPPPSQCGMVFFDGGVRRITFDVTDDRTQETVGTARIAAIHWSCGADGRIEQIAPYTDYPQALRDTGAAQAGLPVINFGNDVWDDFTGGHEYCLLLLQAVFTLSGQPSICQTKPAQPGGRHPLPAKFDPEIRKVKMLVLRENLHRPGESDGDDERVRREYSHRFIVRGFWREQAYGPNHSLRRRQWIPPFVKGPADKPLICKDTVRIWKR
ncbi:hypothetical protein [Bifidobacterium moukalabense]|uniref:hypothetical protein n=1 Tax=Bifidobacterium moukalabense TaxID=1333651 RepID=UPI0010F9E310|nr:hypothetical protein [Bifidobacterium moukalabense]